MNIWRILGMFADWIPGEADNEALEKVEKFFNQNPILAAELLRLMFKIARARATQAEDQDQQQDELEHF